MLQLFNGQKWKSQPYLNHLNMFATCSPTKVSMAPTTPDQKILRKTGISKKQKTKKKQKKKKKRFLSQNEVFFFFSKYRKNSLFNEKNTLSHTKSCKLNLHSSKRHTDMARKGGQIFERVKILRTFPIDNE